MTDKQCEFVSAFLDGPPTVRWNATRAAREAGYSFPNKAGARLLRNPEVRESIDYHLWVLERMTRCEIVAKLLKPWERRQYGLGAAPQVSGWDRALRDARRRNRRRKRWPSSRPNGLV